VSGPQTPKLRDKLARKLEEHADEVVAAYLTGIRSDDPNRAYRAADAWISRVHGRPKETVENVTVPDDPLDIASMTREERDRLKRRWWQPTPRLHASLGSQSPAKPFAKMSDCATVLRGRGPACRVSLMAASPRTPAKNSDCRDPNSGAL
jgi:hypothetical protein